MVFYSLVQYLRKRSMSIENTNRVNCIIFFTISGGEGIFRPLVRMTCNIELIWVYSMKIESPESPKRELEQGIPLLSYLYERYDERGIPYSNSYFSTSYSHITSLLRESTLCFARAATARSHRRAPHTSKLDISTRTRVFMHLNEQST